MGNSNRTKTIKERTKGVCQEGIKSVCNTETFQSYPWRVIHTKEVIYDRVG